MKKSWEQNRYFSDLQLSRTPPRAVGYIKSDTFSFPPHASGLGFLPPSSLWLCSSKHDTSGHRKVSSFGVVLTELCRVPQHVGFLGLGPGVPEQGISP